MTLANDVTVSPFGAVKLAAQPWQFRGRCFVTTVVKATFEIVHDGVMTLCDPSPIAETDQRRHEGPHASIARASDLALFLSTPEIVADAIAFAPAGQPISHLAARIAVQRGGKSLFNKRVDVVGDRRAQAGSLPSPPMPFQSMPLVYERAFGGPTHPENPAGTGLMPDGGGWYTLPNLVSARDPGAVVGFGPLAAMWPVRSARLAPGVLEMVTAMSGQVPELPHDFDAGFFQSAPADQRVEKLIGGELIAMFCMHPDCEALRCYVPFLRGVAMAQTSAGERLPLPLRLDTIHLVPHELRAELVFRGASSFRVDQLEGLRVGGALEVADEPFVFPDMRSVPAAVSVREARAHTMLMEVGSERHGTTLIVEEEQPTMSLPFPRDVRQKSSAPPDTSATPWDPRPPAPVRVADDALQHTVPNTPDIDALVQQVLSERELARESSKAPSTSKRVAPPAEPAAPMSVRSRTNKVQWRKDEPTPVAAPPPAPAAKLPAPRTNFKAALYKKPK
ncbi:MAG: DUF2169 domain-containing protein [Polyangiaceae bacterium]